MPGLALTVATPWIVVTLPTAIHSNVKCPSQCVPFLDGQIGRPGSPKLDQQPDESAIHSTKEKQQ
jgi:hypothetical protein